MMNEMVVAVDGAGEYVKSSACCLDCAGRIAARIGARVSLVHVVGPVTSELESLTPYRYEGVLETAKRERKQRMQDTERELRALEQRVEECWAVSVDAEVTGGPVGATTERVARNRHANMLVARGSGEPCPAGYLATVPDRIVSDLRIPVLFLRDDTCHMLGSLERVLALLDGSTSAEAALLPARRVLPAAGGLLHLLVVVPPQRPRPLLRGHSARPLSRDEAEAYLDAVASRPELAGLTIDWTVAVDGDVVEAVCAVVDSTRANLVTASPHKRGPLGRDAVRQLRDGVPVPLLVCPPGTSATRAVR